RVARIQYGVANCQCSGIENAAAEASRIIAKRAISDLQRGVANGATPSRSCVAAECAIAKRDGGTGTVYAAALVGRVIANRTINDVQGSRIEDPAADAPRVASESAADNGQDGGAASEDATAEAGVTIPDGEAGYGDGFAWANLEGRIRGVAVDG